MRTQQEMMEKFLPEIKANGRHAKKSAIVAARPAIEGEYVKTINAEGFETEAYAKAGDVFIKNIGSPMGETYLVGGETFAKKYQSTGTAYEGNLEIHSAKGEVMAIECTEEHPKVFMAAFGSQMHTHAGGFLVAPLDYGEIYFIGKQEFENTYKFV
jgi:hypothetical protein